VRGKELTTVNMCGERNDSRRPTNQNQDQDQPGVSATYPCSPCLLPFAAPCGGIAPSGVGPVSDTCAIPRVPGCSALLKPQISSEARGRVSPSWSGLQVSSRPRSESLVSRSCSLPVRECINLSFALSMRERMEVQ
jgi:hypothetical protein